MDSVIAQLDANMGIDIRGSFFTPVERKSILSNLKPSLFEADSSAPATAAQAESTESRNVASVLSGDGEFHLSSDSYFGSCSLENSVSGFWTPIWDSLRITWAPKMYHYFVGRPYVNTERYPKHIALVLIKDALKPWPR